MDLDFQPRTVGRPSIPPPVEVIGEVDQADLELLKVERPEGTQHLKRLSDRHHSVARLLAAGHAPGEVSAITGYDPSRISILQNDPAFKDLLARYRATEEFNAVDIAARVRDAAATAVTKLVDRLEEDPNIDFADLNRSTRDLLDRAGFGPKSTRDVNITLGLAEQLEAARQRAKVARGEAPPITGEAPPMTLELDVVREDS
jgi:hypothetical protein